MKSILGLIALIFIALAAYVYMQKGQEIAPTKTMAHTKVKATEVKEVGHTESIQKVSKKKSSVKSKTVKSPKVVSEEPMQERVEEMGKGLTLESIENDDVSDEEEERMRDDLAYTQSLVDSGIPLPSEEEILKIMEDDTKNAIKIKRIEK